MSSLFAQRVREESINYVHIIRQVSAAPANVSYSVSVLSRLSLLALLHV